MNPPELMALTGARPPHRGDEPPGCAPQDVTSAWPSGQPTRPPAVTADAGTRVISMPVRPTAARLGDVWPAGPVS